MQVTYFFYLNINSIGKKFDNFYQLVAGNVDILSFFLDRHSFIIFIISFFIAETKLNPLFLNLEFLIPGFHNPQRIDVSSWKRGILVYITSSLPSKMLTKFKLPDNIQIIPFELKLRNKKRLFIGNYKPSLQNN